MDHSVHKLTLIILLSCCFAHPACAQENVEITENSYRPPEKRPALDVDSAFREKETAPKRAPANRPAQFVPQGRTHTDRIVQAQKENKKEMTLEKKEEVIQDTMSDLDNQYRKLGNLYYTKMLMQAENEIIALRRKQILDQKKFEEEISLKTDSAEFDRLMGMTLPGGAQPLPVIAPQGQQASPVVPEVRREPAPRRRESRNEEPQLRVVGIQGYKGKFSAQIMNQGGITNISPGMDLDHGIHILAISEDGVKVRRTRQDENGESRTEVITLPLSR